LDLKLKAEGSRLKGFHHRGHRDHRENNPQITLSNTNLKKDKKLYPQITQIAQIKKLKLKLVLR
jgi:hypothetical protein